MARFRGTSPELIDRARQFRSEATRAEAELWRRPRAGRLVGWRFRRQHPIGTFVLDFYCAKAKLAVELDGRVHDVPAQAQRDEERTEILTSLGIRVLRFRNEQIVENADVVLDEILKAVTERTL